jgi:hypothetical protein
MSVSWSMKLTLGLQDFDRQRQEVGGRAARTAPVTVSLRPRCQLSDICMMSCVAAINPRPFDALK